MGLWLIVPIVFCFSTFILPRHDAGPREFTCDNVDIQDQMISLQVGYVIALCLSELAFHGHEVNFMVTESLKAPDW